MSEAPALSASLPATIVDQQQWIVDESDIRIDQDIKIKVIKISFINI